MGVRMPRPLPDRGRTEVAPTTATTAIPIHINAGPACRRLHRWSSAVAALGAASCGVSAQSRM